MNSFKKGFILFVLMFGAFVALSAQEEVLVPEAEEAEASGVEFSFEVENGTEFNVVGDLENETTVVVSVSKEIADGLTLGGQISSYTDLLEDKSSSITEGDTEHFNSAYLAEERLAGYMDISYSPLEWLTINSSIGAEFNARPDDYLYAYRVGFGLSVGLEFDYAEHFLSCSIENKATPLWGLGKDEAQNCLLLNDFAFNFRYDVFNYIKEDINLGFFLLTELAAESYFSNFTSGDQEAHKGTPLLLDLEFFAGVVYNPADFVELSAAFALFNCVENDIASKVEDRTNKADTEFGVRVAVDFNFDNIAFGIGYRPHLASTEDNFEAAHVMDVTVALSF